MAEQIPFSVADNLLMKLGSVVSEEIGLMYGVQKELRKLKDTLSSIKAVLVDAEEQQQRSHAVATWVQRLKDVLYAADDLLDDFSMENLRRKTEMQGIFAGQVGDFFSSSNQLAFRVKMGHRIKDVRERLDDIGNDISKFSFIPRVISDTRIENRGRETHSFEVASDMIGREENEKEMIELLMQSSNEENVSLLGIVGIGGLGKTSLAQLVYNNDRVEKYFELKSWVCVSDDFDVKVLIGNIIKSATNKETEKLNLDQLQKHLRMIINGKRYLLVLDDVWNEDPEKWNQIRKLLVNGANGSKIVVTTRSFRVASAMGIDSPYVLQGLNKDDSWSLFKKLAFKQGQEEVYQNFTSIGKDIVEKCKGVPLVIRLLASALKSQTKENQWLSIRDNENLMFLDDGKILSVLKLSYDTLPSHLKQCFAYCALFPKDYRIAKDLLIHLWMAQGYIQSSRGSQHLEEVGEQYFEELLWRSFFQEIEKDANGNIVMCKMHDLIHDLAQSVVNSEVSILKDVNDITERVRHASLVTPINYWEVLRAKSLRTFLLCFNHNVHLGGPLVNIRCQYLRVLDLHRLNIAKVPKCFSKLSHLRYLDLSESDFDELPKVITTLQNLQTLKLLCCRKLKNLPRDMRKLINLRHLLIYGCASLTHMPSGLAQLAGLQSLPLFVVGKGSGDANYNGICRLSELKCLNHLRRELRILNLENVRDAALESREAILKGKQYLRSLRLHWRTTQPDRGKDAELVMEGLLPHSNLKELYISGYGGVRFPSWMMNDGLCLLLPNLVKIAIWSCRRCQRLPLFCQLPSLEHLELGNLTELVYMKESSSAMPFFPSLKILKINGLPNWKGWWRRDQAGEQGPSFPRLSELEIKHCPNLTSLTMHSSPSLSKLVIINCHYLESLLLHSSPSLSHLEISFCHKLTAFCQSSVPCLEELNDLCDVYKEPFWQPMLVFTSLRTLLIRNCQSLMSLSQGIQYLTSLETLDIWKCSQLDFSVNEDDDDTSMRFQRLRSLRHLTIQYIPKLVHLPRWLQHVTTLETLTIGSCSGLIALPDWIGSFTSLTHLQISECPELKSLPEGLRSISTLHQLEIYNCPYLLERCRKNIGEDWPKISHVPQVTIE